MQKASLFSDELIKEVIENSKPKAGVYRVIPMPKNKWVVVADISDKPIKTFTLKSDAIAFAKKYIGSKQFEEIVVHGKYGDVTARILN